MTDDQINTMIAQMTLERRGDLLRTNATVLTQAKADAINQLAQLLVAAAPEFFEKKVSVASTNTNYPLFAFPSDYLSIKAVWDYDKSAIAITGAADNGSGAIRITAASHGFSDEDRVNIHGVVGTVEANGQWQIDYVSANTFDLVGSTFAVAYTSGGKVFKESSEAYKFPLERKGSKSQEANSQTTYFTDGSNIIIDDPTFDNDIIVLYRYLPSTLAEIPARMHHGVYAFPSMILMNMPPRVIKTGEQIIESPEYAVKKKNYDLCSELWKSAVDMASHFKPVLGSNNISNRSSVQKWL